MSALIHLRIGGRSQDLPLDDLDLGSLSSDTDVREAVAKTLQVQRRELDLYVVERHQNGNMTMRPEAIFG